MSDVRDLTVRELCALADELRTGDSESPVYRRACDQMAIASWYFEHSGVLWCMGLEQQAPPGFEPEPEAPPPDRKATVVEFPPAGRL